MSMIGSTVIAHKQEGIIFGWSMEKGSEHYLRVRVFDTDDNKYKMKLVLPDDITIIKDPLVLQEGNEHDLIAREEYLRNVLDYAIDMGDKEWFLQIGAELKAIEEQKVGLGRVVMDLKGKHVGIVVSEPNDEKIVTVMSFNQNLRKYFPYEKRIDLIQAASPEKIEEWNKKTNHQELGLRDNLREVLADAAVDTHDKVWFEKINQKEMSDGA